MGNPTTIQGPNEALRRRYGMVGQEGPIVALGSDIFPTVPVDDSRMDPELAFFAGTRLGIGGGTDAADAGAPSGMELFNPAGSGVIAVVQAAFVQVATGQTVKVIFSAVAPDTATAGWNRDARWGTGRCVCNTGPRTVAAATGLATFFATTSGQEVGWCLPFVLTPGSGFFLQGANNNIAMIASFRWRERRMESWETVG